ncbi:amidohydrolase [Acidaminobacter sp. JC074]|uniref:amidohydrolase n=1 Tax=Acidaminobacter sp. JC074 TaxID=2530199 RepID=UPI001F0ECE24|nr:amidohydrolase [Acidaminobacter sp. JC074]MCH4885946.1 amidohydrolase [Acidaminobacter sp. JC074]
MYLIKNVEINNMVEDKVFVADVLIHDGKIQRIEENIEADAKVIDGKGKKLFPGFIDAHTHLGLRETGIGFEGDDVNELSNPLTPELKAIDGINPLDKTFDEAREAGITCVSSGPGSANVIGGQFAIIKTHGRRVDDMIVNPSHAMKIAFGENPKRVYKGLGISPQTRLAVAAELRNILTKAKMYLEKIEAAAGNLDKMPAYDNKLEALLPVLKKEIPLKAHAHRADDIFTAIRIAKEFDLKLTLDHCSEGHMIVEELVEEGYDAIVGPTFGHKTKFETKNKTFTTPGILQRAGLRVAIMTDHPVIPVHYLPIMAGLCAKAGMDRFEALKAITINPAEILGIEDRVGTIEVGKDADLVMMDGHPFELDAKVKMTFVDGHIAYTAD